MASEEEQEAVSGEERDEVGVCGCSAMCSSEIPSCFVVLFNCYIDIESNFSEMRNVNISGDNKGAQSSETRVTSVPSPGLPGDWGWRRE